MATNVVTVVAKLYPKAGKEDELQAILVEQTAAVLKAEPGCLVYRVHRLAKSPTVFLFYEQYRTPEAFERHRTAPHLRAYRERQAGLLDKPTEVEIYQALTE